MVVADWIRLGLGVSLVSSTEPSASSTSSANATIDYSDPSACVASWASYTAFTSTDIALVNLTSTSHFELSTQLTYGTGDVYSTVDGIPVASGNFTPTKVIQTTVQISSTSVSYNALTTYHPAHVSASPTCDVARGCSLLYASYMSSLGLPSNASIPKITPAPANSPRCPAYYYQPFSGCSYWTDPVNTCTVAGQNVQVFYFPPSPTNVTQGKVVYSYAPNITFTSPSIYLSFDWLSATSSAGALESACSSCGPNGCVAHAVGGGDAYQIAGTSIGGALITLAPDEASTFIVSYSPPEASSIASVLGNGGPGYANAQADLSSRMDFYSYIAQPLDLNKLTNPAPTDYYLNPAGAPGCNDTYPQPKCSTILDGEYRPILSLPPHVSDLQPAWSTCLPAVFGVYDPPIALTKGSVADLPTVHGHGAVTTTHGTPPPTALPETLPHSPTPSPTPAQTVQPTGHGGTSSDESWTSIGSASHVQSSIVVDPAETSESNPSTASTIHPHSSDPDDPASPNGSEAATASIVHTHSTEAVDPSGTSESGNSISSTSQTGPEHVASFEIGSQTFTATYVSNNAVFGTHTIAVGGSATNVGGQMVSAASGGIAIGSSTHSWTSASGTAADPSDGPTTTANDASSRPTNPVTVSGAVGRSTSMLLPTFTALLCVISIWL